jgi:hypothetical protein
MNKLTRLGILLTLAVAVAFATASSTPQAPGAHMKARYFEACSCHLFCPCYFNQHAEHPVCEFNMAVNVEEGMSGNVNLAGAKYWLTGDLGDKWGTEKKGSWVTVTFDTKTTQAQRDALAPIILKMYGLDWGANLKVQEAPSEIHQTGDIAEATLDGGKMAHLKLQRVPGEDGKGVTLKNVAYFHASKNDGFEMYKSIEHSSALPGHAFNYSDRNAFLITVTADLPAGK